VVAGYQKESISPKAKFIEGARQEITRSLILIRLARLGQIASHTHQIDALVPNLSEVPQPCITKHSLSSCRLGLTTTTLMQIGDMKHGK
jgi:hypothetical protein